MERDLRVIGIGQTKHRPQRADVSIAGPRARGGAQRALDDAELDLGATSTPSSSARRPTCSRA